MISLMFGPGVAPPPPPPPPPALPPDPESQLSQEELSSLARQRAEIEDRRRGRGSMIVPKTTKPKTGVSGTLGGNTGLYIP